MTNSCFSVGSLQKCYHSDLMTQMSAGQEGQALANAIKTIQTDGKLSPIPFETSPLILTFKWMLLWCKWEWLTTSCKCAPNCSKCFGEYHIWGSYLHHFFQLEHKGSRSPAWKKKLFESQSLQVFSLAKWRCEVQNRHPAVQSPNTPAPSLASPLSENISATWVCICVCRRGRIRRLKQLFSLRTPCLLSAPWHSKRSLFSFPLDTLRLSNNTGDMCKSQNTVPLEPFGCWQVPRRWLTCAAFREHGRVLVVSPYLSP